MSGNRQAVGRHTEYAHYLIVLPTAWRFSLISNLHISITLLDLHSGAKKLKHFGTYPCTSRCFLEG